MTPSAPHFGLDSDRVYFLQRGPKDIRWLKSARLDGSKPRTHVESKEATESHPTAHTRLCRRLPNLPNGLPKTGLTRNLGPKNKALPLVRLSSASGFHPNFTNDSQRVTWQLGAEFRGLSQRGLVQKDRHEGKRGKSREDNQGCISIRC